jgi:signal transduction histidine kinase/ligand-binding sensor domain-containing protein
MAACALVAARAQALNPERPISQYGHTAWRHSEGTFSGIPNAITQTADGYLWIGTETGLLRFDGVQFVRWQPPAGQQLLSSQFVSVLGDRQGGLWLGTGRELAYWKSGALTRYGRSAFRVNSILQDSAGTIWFTRSRVGLGEAGPLCSIAAGQYHCYASEVGIPFEYADPMTLDPRGVVWIGSSLGVVAWDGRRAVSSLPRSLEPFDGLQGVSAIAFGADSSLLVGLSSPGQHLGLQTVRNGTWATFQASGLDGATLDVADLLVDSDHALWIGTRGHGLYHVRPGGVDHFGAAEGLSSDSVRKLFQDREGNLWVTTSRGLDRFRDLRVATFAAAEGLTSNFVSSVAPSRDGSLWVAAPGGLYRWREGQISRVGSPQELPGKMVTALMEDPEGTVWLGIDKALYTYRNGHFNSIERPGEKDHGPVRVIVEDADQNVWVSTTTEPEVRRYRNGKLQESVPITPGTVVLDMARNPAGGIWVALTSTRVSRLPLGRMAPGHFELERVQGKPVPSGHLTSDVDGSLWITPRTGLVLLQQDRQRELGLENGLPCDHFYSAIRDRTGALWLYAECGLLRVSRSELDRWRANPRSTVQVEQLDSGDGAQPGDRSFSPGVAQTADGRLWFVTEAALQMVDPLHDRLNRLAPPVHVENLAADGKIAVSWGDIQLPALTREINITYTALSLTLPEKIHFRYRLEGLQDGWQDAGNRRQALYENLAPGRYCFQVIASNNDGLWNTAGATVVFTIPPAWYQTVWFRSLCLVALALTIWLIIALRIRAVTTQIQSRLMERVGERERIARELHDTLLQGFHGLMLRFQVATQLVSREQRARAVLEETLDRADTLLQESRERIRNLRREEGAITPLPEALARAGEELRYGTGIAIAVSVEGTLRELNPLVADDVYLVGREALTNAFRHSQGANVEVEITFGEAGLTLRVRDDGRGISPETLSAGGVKGHWGLAGMRERASRIGGELTVWNRRGAGTEVELSVPAEFAYSRPQRISRWRRALRRFGRVSNSCKRSPPHAG